MPPGNDGSTTVTFLTRELEAALVKIESLEKENHELKQEASRLRAQVNTLKAHDIERKSILWKKLHNSIDRKVTDEPPPPPPPKPKFHVEPPEAPIKKPSSNPAETAANQPKPPPSPPHRRTAAAGPPPPPPPLPTKPVGSKAVRRVPAVMEFYRSLMKRDTQQRDNKNGGGTGFVPAAYSRDMIGEIENRSTYLSSIKSDVEKYAKLLDFLTREIQNAAFSEISDVEAFVKWLDAELGCLVDERAVLKHFPQWPERKSDALREAAFSYRDLKNLEAEVLAFKNDPKQPLTQTLRKIQGLQDRVEQSVSSHERVREGTSKRYKELQIPWQWLMDTGVIGQVKLSSLTLAKEHMKRVANELQCNDTLRDGDLLLQAVRFAFRVHQFAGGFDTETMHAFEELKAIGTGIYKQ